MAGEVGILWRKKWGISISISPSPSQVCSTSEEKGGACMAAWVRWVDRGLVALVSVSCMHWEPSEV